MKKDMTRRKFLKTIAGGSVVTVAATAVPSVMASSEPPKETPDTQTRYRETDHVRRFYASLRDE